MDFGVSFRTLSLDRPFSHGRKTSRAAGTSLPRAAHDDSPSSLQSPPPLHLLSAAGAPQGLVDVFCRCFSLDVASRFGDAPVLIAALNEVMSAAAAADADVDAKLAAANALASETLLTHRPPDDALASGALLTHRPPDDALVSGALLTDRLPVEDN